MSRILGILLIFMIISTNIAATSNKKIEKHQKDRAEELAERIIKVIQHKIKVQKTNGKTIAYGQITLVRDKGENKRELVILAGASNKIYLGYEIVPLDRSVTNPSGGWAKVYGYVGVKDSTGFHPLEGVYVEAWDRDGDGTEDFLGSTNTDSVGYFEISFDNTDGWGGAYGNQDVFLKMFLDTSYAVIQRSGSTYWTQMEDDCSEVPDDTASSVYLSDENNNGAYDVDSEYYYITASGGKGVRYIFEETLIARNVNPDANGNYYISNPNPAGAAQILWYIQEAVKFMQSEVGITPPKIYVEFSDQYASTYYDENTGKLYVSGYAGNKDWEDMSLVLKEYAKFLLKQYSVLPSSAGFDWSAHQDQQTAWVEGFGAYFGSAVKNYAGVSSPYLYDDYPNTYNLETQYDSDDSLNDADICGAIAGILWDLYDGTNDDQDGDGVGDSYSIPFSYIWDVVDNDNPTTIIEFWNGLNSRYSVDDTKVWEIYWEHGVNLDSTAPSAPTITDYDPTTGVWISQDYITVYWSASTDDMSGIKRYLVIVYKDGSYYDTYDAGTSLSYKVNDLPTGSYYVKVRAEDRAGNTADSTQVGPFKLDTSAPTYSNPSPTGTIYDSKSDDIVLSIDWTDVGGGVTEVKFRYKYSSWSSYTAWSSPSSSVGSTYSYSVSVTEWKQHIGEYLYWETYAKDAAGNIAYSSTYSIYLDDDDSSGPSISNIETSGDIYDSASQYVIRATITDPSGLSSVQIIWKFEGGTWNYWDATYVGSDVWEIVIDKSNWETTELWNGNTELLIYYYIVAIDNDNDRTNDKATSYYGTESSPKYAGKIYDDDTDPPSIVSITTTGNIYDNYADDFKISVTFSDASGVASVKIYWSFDNQDWNPRDATRYLDTWYILITRSEWSNAPQWENSDSITIYYYIWAIDNDNDRVYDQSEMTTSPDIAGTITDDDPNPPSITPVTSGIIYDNTSKPYYINATITDDSGLSSVLFRWSFDQANWYEWTPNRTGDLYWIAIDKSLWASEDLWINRTYISIYYQIIATDADNDRIYDSKTKETAITEAGKIYDDDTDSPSISNIVTSGIMYDNDTKPFYINATVTDKSGLYNITFYWRIEDLDWNAWTPTRIDNTDTYYIAIDKSIWGSTDAWQGRTYITVYYYIVAWDADMDRAHDQLKSQTNVNEAGKIYDDDSTKPSITSVVTSGNIYDNHTGAFYINATIKDQSGLSNVTIKWSFDNNTWNLWQANNTGNLYWIAISKSLWASSDVWEGKTYITIYYQIIAIDDDFDRPHDELSTTTSIDVAGNIYDDDTEPPEIYNVVTSGIIYDNSTRPFYINATILDDSGMSNVTIKWNINNMTWHSWEATQEGNKYYIAIDKSIWASTSYWEGRTYITIYYQIIAIDADNDRSYDSLMTTSEVQEAGKIYDDDTDPPAIDNVETTGVIYDNHTGPFYINITLGDKSGIYNATIYYSFDNNTFHFLNPNVEGNKYWIAIGKEIWSSTDAWQNSNYITIYYYIIAYDNDNDRGDVDRSELTSNIAEAGKIFDDDTTEPQITSITYTGNDTGYIYDNYTGGIYINATIEDESGIWNVTFYWKFNNGSWHQWEPYNEGNKYYIIIERSVWASAQEWTAYQLTIYYIIVTWDADMDRINDQLSTDTGERQGPIVYDDDTETPQIAQVTYTGNDTGMIYDNYPGDIYINATITDGSGLDNVTFYWRFNDGEWNAWTPNNDGDSYWIAIPRDVWAQSPYWYSTNLTIYYRIVAWDADMDRPNDQLMSDTGEHPGPLIVDDDDNPPQITQVTYTGNDTGMIYDNYPGDIYINATITDGSGLDNVTFYWRFNDGEWNAWTPNNDGDLYWIAIPRDVWAQSPYWYSTNLTIYYRIVAWDADMDRPNDQLMSDTGEHPGPLIVDDDDNPPQIAQVTYTGNDTGMIYDNYPGDIYINATITDGSGLDNVTFYWRFNDGEWNAWTPNNDGDLYWIAIPRDVWAQSPYWYSTNLTIYYRIVAWDADMDRPNDQLMSDTGEHPGPLIVDDDDNPPQIAQVTYTGNDTGMIYDNYPGDIYINATITDESGIDNVTIWWRFNDGEWNAWTPNNDGDLYWIAIPRDVWAQSPYWYSTNLTIYYRIVAWDADMDRPNDQLMSDTGEHPGPLIVDDDDNPPQITQVTYTGNDTGMIYDNYPGDIYINATITDESGIDNVTIWWRFNDGEWNAWAANYDPVNDVYWIAIPRDVWAQSPYWYSTNLTIYYRIVAWDADMDRPNDQLMSDTGEHPGPLIVDDDDNPPQITQVTYTGNDTGMIYDNYPGDIYINATITDESGIDNVTIWWRFNDGEWNAWAANYDPVNDVYWIAISRALWASTDYWYSMNLTIYYRIVAWDADMDRPNDQLMSDTGEHPGPLIVDDDTTPPTISNVTTTGVVNDSYMGDFYINCTVYDESGVSSVIIMWRLGESGSWFNSSVNNDGGLYWVSISRSLWASAEAWQNSSTLFIYYRIIATDNDDDRPNDKLDMDTGVHQAGTIVDDDTEGPIIHNIYFLDMDSDGYLESDETFKVTVEASDVSGIRNITIGIYVEESLVCTYVLGNGVYIDGGRYVTVNIGPLPAGNVTVVVWAEDDDNDRDKYDTAVSESQAIFSVELEEISLQISPLNVHMDYGDVLALSIYVEDSDGSYAISSMPAIIRIYNGSTIIYELEITLELYNEEIISIPINMSAGMWYLMVLAGDSEHFEATSRTTKVYIHQDTAIDVYLEYTRLVQYETIEITAYLCSEDGTPLVHRNISFYIVEGDSLRLLGYALTNGSGYAIFEWTVDEDVGIYNIKAIFDDEEYYYGSEKVVKVEIVESEALIDVEAENATIRCVYSDSADITLQLYNWRTGEPLSNEKIDIYVVTKDSEFLLGSGITNKDGLVTIHIASIDLMPGEYLAIAKWAGNDRFAPTQTRFMLIVEKENVGTVDIILNPETVYYSDTLTITIVAMDDDGEIIPSIDAEITIYEGDTPVDKLSVKIVNGTTNISWSVVGLTYAPQTLSLEVELKENDYYNGGHKKVAFNVEQEEIVIGVNIEEPVIVEEETTISIAIADDEGVPVDYIDVKVYIDDVLYKEDIAINGRLNVPWTPSRKGTVTIRVVVGEENPCYKQVEEEIDVEIVERKVPTLLQNIIPGMAMAIAMLGILGYVKKKRKKPEIEGLEEEIEEAEATPIEDIEIEDIDELE